MSTPASDSASHATSSLTSAASPAVAAPNLVPLVVPNPGELAPAILSQAQARAATYRQRFTPETGNLQLLSAGEHELPAGTTTGRCGVPGEEALLFAWQGRVTVEVDGARFALEPYDSLYVPLGAGFRIHNGGGESARLFQLSSPVTTRHPVRHGRFAELSRREDRIRRLKGKDVYVMHGEDEAADKLIAGYTFFEPHARSWPPHNHTDQEEVYVFLEGRGSMEVYESAETLTFVRQVTPGDMVTIPVMNYHPVFSQEQPVKFIWCIAGARYWVGDKSKAFMRGDSAPVTT